MVAEPDIEFHAATAYLIFSLAYYYEDMEMGIVDSLVNFVNAMDVPLTLQYFLWLLPLTVFH
jgi:hypothetical protein